MKLGLWSSPEDAFLEFVYATEEEGLIQLIIRSKHQSCCCPDCGKASFRPHSHYTRIIQDLPIGEKAISLLLISRKWFCDNPTCDRKIFTERYDWIAENGRRTMRAEGVLREIAFSSSCLNGEKLARTVHLPVSHDTLLSIIKKTEINPVYPPFVGIDEFALLKGHTYGTIICDLITHEPVALLSDRNVDTVVSWLKRHPFVKLVSRDGFRPFREAVSQASATIVQVYDRWHLLRGAKRQLELYLTSVLPSAVSVPNSATDQAEPLSGYIPETKYQRQRWERYEKKWALIRQIQEEHQKGKNISVLAREFQLDRRTIRKYLNTTSIPIITRRKSRRPINDFYDEVKRFEGERKTVKEIY